MSDLKQEYEKIESPRYPADQYLLQDTWYDFVPENWNKHFICGEVGAFYCKCRRPVPPVIHTTQPISAKTGTLSL